MRNKNIEDFYPLSPMQQGMYFHSQYAPGTGIYVEQLSCRIKNHLDKESFKKAWQQMITNNSILRSSYYSTGLNEPIQIVNKNVELSFIELDWSELHDKLFEKEFNGLRKADQLKGFDLEKAPLMRFTLIKGDDGYHFIWTYHHILLDGWSVPMILEELLIRYNAISKGGKAELPLRNSYRDYIIWIKKHNINRASEFWKSYLADFSSPTPLNCDKYYGKNESADDVNAQLELKISKQTTELIENLAKKNNITVNTCIQAAWGLLLSFYSGLDDVLFGATVSGRPADLINSEKMIGCFINTLPVRIKTDPQQSVAELLKKIQIQQIEARMFEYSSLIDIQKVSSLPAGVPMFDTILVFENFPVKSVLENNPDILSFDKIQTLDKTNFPLTIAACLNDNLLFKFIYSSARFEHDTIIRMMNHFENILQSFKDPNTKIKNIEILNKSEAQLIDEWNSTDTLFNSVVCLHEEFEKRAEQNPNGIALFFDGQQMTYRELNRRSNIIANKLVEMGAKPEQIIGIALNRSFDMIIALLGVLKAGSAYLPIDPNYPAERIRFMIEDSRVQIIITDDTIEERELYDKLTPLYINNEIKNRTLDREKPLLNKSNSENLAYVIYTSGSTGTPKGVMIQHKGVLNLARSYRKSLKIDSGVRVFQFFSFSFDGAVADIFSTLLSGGTLILVNSEMLIPGTALFKYINDSAANIILFPPSVISVMGSAKFSELHTILSGGEACSLQLAKKWGSMFNFINAYGPTEISVAAAMYKYNPNDNYDILPIGRPLDNMKIYILNRFLNPVPIGVPGEIYISGIGTARGYLNRQELTAEKFIPNHLSGIPGDRMYKSGDLGRWLPDGNIEYLGRTDTQVKVRGYRIELGEIEAVIASHPEIIESAAVIKEYKNREKTIIGYYVQREGSSVTPGMLHRFLSKRIPSFMMPSSLIWLDKMPLTSNFKINKKALPDPDGHRAEGEIDYFPPRDSIELKLVQLWEEVLNISPIGIRENFFHLGGHSMLAVRLIGLIQDKFKITIELVQIFKEPTIENLASIIRSQEKTDEFFHLLVELKKGEEKGPLVFVHPSGGSVHWYAELARHIDTSYSFYGIQAKGIDGKQELDDKIETMAFRYVDILLKKQPKGPYYIGGWSFGVIVAYEMAQQLTAMGHEVAMLALLDQGPYLLEEEPADTAELLVNLFERNFKMTTDLLRKLNYDDQLKYALKRAKKAGIMPFYVRHSEFKYYISVLVTMRNAWHKYKAVPYKGRITLFRSAENLNSPLGPFLGWDELSIGGIDVIDVPGDHISMMFSPNVLILAEKINNELKKINKPVSEVLNEMINE